MNLILFIRQKTKLAAFDACGLNFLRNSVEGCIVVSFIVIKIDKITPTLECCNARRTTATKGIYNHTVWRTQELDEKKW